jgi:hypothetical protein
VLDILELLVARIFEGCVDLAAHLLESVIGYANAARLLDTFQSRGDIDAVAENITLLDDDIANVNADTDFNALFGRDVLITLRHSALRLDRTAGGIHGTAEFDQYSVASTLDDAAVVLGDRRLKEFPAVSVEPSEYPFLVRAHKPTVAGNIRRKNGSEPPLHALFGHVERPYLTVCGILWLNVPSAHRGDKVPGHSRPMLPVSPAGSRSLGAESGPITTAGSR